MFACVKCVGCWFAGRVCFCSTWFVYSVLLLLCVCLLAIFPHVCLFAVSVVVCVCLSVFCLLAVFVVVSCIVFACLMCLCLLDGLFVFFVLFRLRYLLLCWL